MTTPVILGIGLIANAAILWIQYQNMIERRHGEIVQLRARALSTLSNIRQRTASNVIRAETIRLEIRRLADSDAKFEAIEKIPDAIQTTKTLFLRIDELIPLIEKIDPKEMNHSLTLLSLQRTDKDIEEIERTVRRIDDAFISMLANIERILNPA